MTGTAGVDLVPGMRNLDALHLILLESESDSAGQDLQLLENVPVLRSLMVIGDRLVGQNLSLLQRLTSLSTLFLSECPPHRFEDWAGLSQLEHLTLEFGGWDTSGCALTSLSGLTKLHR